MGSDIWNKYLSKGYKPGNIFILNRTLPSYDMPSPPWTLGDHRCNLNCIWLLTCDIPMLGKGFWSYSDWIFCQINAFYFILFMMTFKNSRSILFSSPHHLLQGLFNCVKFLQSLSGRCMRRIPSKHPNITPPAVKRLTGV